jgi:hypothetical protein
MSSLIGLLEARSSPLRFLESEEADSLEFVTNVEQELLTVQAKVLFADASVIAGNPMELLDKIVDELPGSHGPYGTLPWAEFIDDLGIAADRYSVLVIFIGGADQLLRQDPMFFCKLIEGFLTQQHRWVGKRCVMVLEMGHNAAATRAFRSMATQGS